MGHEAVSRENGTDAPVLPPHPAVSLHCLAPGVRIVSGGQQAQCVQSYIRLLAEPSKQIRELLERQRCVGAPGLLKVVMVHDGHDGQIAVRVASRFGERWTEFGELTGARKLGETAGFDRSVFTARREVEETLLGKHGSGDVVEGIERRNEPRDCTTKYLSKRRSAGHDFLRLLRRIKTGEFGRRAGLGLTGFMAEPVLGDFHPAGLSRLDEVAHLIGRQDVLSGVRNDRKGGANIVHGHGMQYSALECMVADRGWIIEANGDVDHGQAPDRFR